ncbi:hypothetical protein [Anaerosporobacter sp.]|uniref:hypothetical protein n=1 Tax=Anaerosporobacter sp. TaxID=1872529 RepID=UPI00286F85AB|nr:hypothetical protein [Anaerosporobacter sp.]
MTENKSGIEKKACNTQKKKKSIRLMFILLMVLTMVYVVVWSIKTPSAIEDLNNNIDLPYKFTTPMSECDIVEKKIEDEYEYGVYVETYNGDSYRFSGYPDMSSSYKLTSYYTKNTKVSLFGFKVGDSLNEANKLLRKHGYISRDKDTCYYEYRNGGIVVLITVKHGDGSSNDYFKDGVIVNYMIKLESTDKKHIGYYK